MDWKAKMPKDLLEFFKQEGAKGGKKAAGQMTDGQRAERAAKAGKAAATALTAKQRSERARKAAAARWERKKGGD